MVDLLPNCLTNTPKIDWSLSGQNGTWYYLFCANCGADGGRVLDTSLPKQFAFYLCDSCAEKYGSLTTLYMEPDAVFWEKVRQAQMEKFGRELTEPEIIEALKDGSHILTKLSKERN